MKSLYVLLLPLMLFFQLLSGGCGSIEQGLNNPIERQGAEEIKKAELEEKEQTKNPKKSPIKAVVILLHGLNLKPQKMDDWSNLLSRHGAQVIRLALYGHTGDEADMKNVTADEWRSQFKAEMKIVQSLAKTYNVPIHFVGYSLGGLVGLEWLAQSEGENHTFSKIALIAPALSVHWYVTAALKASSVLGKSTMIFPHLFGQTFPRNNNREGVNNGKSNKKIY